MNKLPWPQFRTVLFKKMEHRRSKAAMFRIEQIYELIELCAKLWADHETDEAQKLVMAIAEEGTFLLVADSLTEFCDLFPPVESEVAPTTKPTRPSSNPSQPQPTRDARQRSGSPFRQE